MCTSRWPLIGLTLAAMLLVSVVPAVATPSPDGPVRLLVTYAAPVDGEAEADAFGLASAVTGDGDASSVQVLEFDGPAAADASLRSLVDRPDVVSVEPDYPLYPDGQVDAVWDLGSADAQPGSADAQPGSADAQPASADAQPGSADAQPGSADAQPGADTADPSLTASGSWGVDNDGESIDGVAGRPGIDIGAPHAWPQATGDGIVVAVIDSGVDTEHPLLRDRIWVNPDEARNGIDSDGNGYTDDLHGWDFANDRAEVFASADRDAHGTHVAGIVAAATHEESGFRSVAPDARIMPLKFIDGAEGRTSDAIAAIKYAQANGADLINASWGGPSHSEALRTVLAEVEIPVVVAAGNLGEQPGSPPTYPTAYGLDNLISVAAIDHTGAMPDFSSRSRELVDVAAPGTRILSAWPDRRLATSSGTSQAAPHVAGLLALALERHPDQNPVVLAAAVRNSVRPLSGADQTRSGGLARAPGLLAQLGTRVPACPTLPEVPFADVTADGAHHDAVACMLALGVTSGISATTYGSADGLSRAHIATMLANAMLQAGELPPVPTEGVYLDVPETNVHRDNIERLAAVGIVWGSQADLYEPARTVTRAEFAAAVARAVEWLAEGDVRAVGPPFDDIADHLNRVSINKAAGLGVVTGRRAGVFDPDVALRRDQAASMVTRMLDRLVQQGLMDAA